MSTATILDVARRAKVSAGTVSRVLNRHPAVSPEKAEQVRRAIEALDYSPRQRKASMADVNPLERKNVLLLMLGMDRSLAALPVVAAAIEGVEHAVREARANLLISNVPAVDRVPDVVVHKRVDGVILKGALQGDLIGAARPELISRLRGLPTVWVLGRPAGAWGDAVQVNDSTVGQIAAQYLLAAGHRALAFLSPKPSQSTIMRRQAAFTFTAEENGATVKPYLGDRRKWTFPSPAIEHVELVQDLVDRMLKERRRPTAVFAPDDSVGAMTARALSARGLTLGRDISLISCNNERPLLMGIHPALTTIDIHAHEIGRRAVDQLAWRLAHPEASCVDIGLEPQLVEGESVRRL
jgi:DNA-binding LacI/PurR family transcriptional regulator